MHIIEIGINASCNPLDYTSFSRRNPTFRRAIQTIRKMPGHNVELTRSGVPVVTEPEDTDAKQQAVTGYIGQIYSANEPWRSMMEENHRHFLNDQLARWFSGLVKGNARTSDESILPVEIKSLSDEDLQKEIKRVGLQGFHLLKNVIKRRIRKQEQCACGLALNALVADPGYITTILTSVSEIGLRNRHVEVRMGALQFLGAFLFTQQLQLEQQLQSLEDISLSEEEKRNTRQAIIKDHLSGIDLVFKALNVPHFGTNDREVIVKEKANELELRLFEYGKKLNQLLLL